MLKVRRADGEKKRELANEEKKTSEETNLVITEIEFECRTALESSEKEV